ncbi:hypothetical protein ACFXTO_001655 [Malus domestica]
MADPHGYQQFHHFQGVPSGLVLAGTVIALTIATPLLVIFSPVLVPATSESIQRVRAFGSPMGKHGHGYVTGKQPPGADQLDSARHKLAGKAREMKDRAEQFGQQHTSGQHRTP